VPIGGILQIDGGQGRCNRRSPTGRESDVSTTDEPISFDRDIKPLFRDRDRESMSSHFDLWSHDDVARASDAILARLRDGSMPCDGAWPDERVALFEGWIAAGKPA
jgi:hypothetical protein